MELITLYGLVVVVFGLWVEFALAVKAVGKMIRKSSFCKGDVANTAGRQPAQMSRLPVCLTKLPSYRQGV